MCGGPGGGLAVTTFSFFILLSLSLYLAKHVVQLENPYFPLIL
jgi:hypothetical protein